MKKHNNLMAPIDYWNMTPTKLALTNNYCGSSGFVTNIVPDNLLGINISEVCRIHDYMYEQGKDKQLADETFLNNMFSIINKESKMMILKSLRKAKAYLYYFAVKLFGKPFFRALHY